MNARSHRVGSGCRPPRPAPPHNPRTCNDAKCTRSACQNRMKEKNVPESTRQSPVTSTDAAESLSIACRNPTTIRETPRATGANRVCRAALSLFRGRTHPEEDRDHSGQMSIPRYSWERQGSKSFSVPGFKVCLQDDGVPQDRVLQVLSSVHTRLHGS